MLCFLLVVSTGLVYLAGGIGEQSLLLRSVTCYNPATKHWSSVADMTRERCYFSLVELDGALYAVGGAGSIVLPWFQEIGFVEKYSIGEVNAYGIIVSLNKVIFCK